jgi:hypothetical protein
MQVNNFLFRCSSLGNIVTKSGKLTDGAKTYISDCFIGELYGVKKEAYGKALEKGIATEQDIMQLINDAIYPGQFVAKITEGKRNEYIIGTPDVLHGGIVYDCKSAWDLFTFGKAQLSHLYEWQLKAYMWLYGVNRARLFYGLVDLPDYMLYSEVKSLFYKNPGRWVSMESPEFLEAAEEFEKAHKYGNMPLYERFKVWDLELTDEDIERMKNAVIDARTYMAQLYKEHLEMVEKNKSFVIKKQTK